MNAKDDYKGASKIAYPVISPELLDIICKGKKRLMNRKKKLTVFPKT
jgi:hypothetical protein